MILLADGGSTKVDWRLIDNGTEILQVTTLGANPFLRTREDISEELKRTLIPQLEGYDIQSVHFYGAGCAFPDKNEIVRQAIEDNVTNAQIEINSDLLAAARGLCGRENGIAAILGTGSNSCYYDGEKILDNVSPLGYIIGDEGSGAVLGRLFLGACLKNQLTLGIKEKLMSEINMSIPDILDRIYKQPMPNKFLASFAPFIRQNIEDESVYNLVFIAFKNFFLRNIMQYDYKNTEVHITGSIGFYFQDMLKDVAKGFDIQIGQITPSPMDGLIKYYSEI